MTSRKKRKRQAQASGLTEAELDLCELLGEVLEVLRWNQILAWGNQYLIQQKLGLSAEERNQVMRAAASSVERDGRMQDWGRRLIEIHDALREMHARMQQGAPPLPRVLRAVDVHDDTAGADAAQADAAEAGDAKERDAADG